MEKKKAALSVGNILLDVSLTTLAAFGGAIANPLLAASPTAALVAKQSLPDFIAMLRAKQQDGLALPVPNWWSGDERAWQEVCTHIEHHLPSIMEATAQQLRQVQQFPTTDLVQYTFINEIGRHLSPSLVDGNSQNLVAVYIAPPFLNKTASILKSIVDPIKDDAVAKQLAALATTLEQVAAASTAPQSAAAIPTTGSTLTPSTSSTATASPAELLEQKLQQEAYDVYVCYHEADRTAVREIDARLKAQGILPWFDVLTMEPGGVLQTEQHQQISKVKAMAVFIGKHAVEDWQALQVQAFLDQFVERKTDKVKIIPVFLPDAPEKPEMSVFLKLFKGVDFRQKVPDPFAYLLWGITGKRPPLASLGL